ncbi:MAG TPA: hypothetical protein VE643_01805 [Nitrososphaeraceae archaeon]|nr:hypothetical protein [Nitrososphaeraceae archaeon]
MNQVYEEDGNNEEIDEIREDNIEAANKQLKFRKKIVINDDTDSRK